MPLRDVVCPIGHRVELLVRSNATPTCPCGRAGSFDPVNRITVGGKPHITDYELPHDMRDAHEQAQGYKYEYVSALDEARQNGWTP